MSQHTFTVDDYFRDMLDAVVQIQTYTSTMSESEFFENRLVQDGVVRNLITMGECARNITKLDPSAEMNYPDIPFFAIYAMRNRITHGYMTVDYGKVWEVVLEEIPELRQTLLTLITPANDVS